MKTSKKNDTLWLGKCCLCILFFAGYLCANAQGVNRHRIGPIYNIGEPDLIEQMQEKIKAMESNGKMALLKQDFFDRSKRNLASPVSLRLPRATQPRSWLIDPSYVVPTDMRDDRGQIFARAGQRINALDMRTQLSKPLLFLDASDPVQKTALPNMMREHGPVKIILTGGQWRDLSASVGQQVFVDQGGKLIANFRIQALPALVKQSKNRLLVEEISL